MKHKIPFGLTVFTTLVMFTAIFVTYLERNSVNDSATKTFTSFTAVVSADR